MGSIFGIPRADGEQPASVSRETAGFRIRHERPALARRCAPSSVAARGPRLGRAGGLRTNPPEKEENNS
jgi:hypothetical protein